MLSLSLVKQSYIKVSQVEPSQVRSCYLLLCQFKVTCASLVNEIEVLYTKVDQTPLKVNLSQV